MSASSSGPSWRVGRAAAPVAGVAPARSSTDTAVTAGAEHLGRVGRSVGHDGRRLGVLDDVRDLGRGRRRVDRHEGGAGRTIASSASTESSVPRARPHDARAPAGPVAGQDRRQVRRPLRQPRAVVDCGRDPARRPAPRAAGWAAQCAGHAPGSVAVAGGEARASCRRHERPDDGRPQRHSLAVMTARRIAIVPHTHWDREWYEPFQDFRLDLVELLDTLIPLLERDATYPCFLLDGQMAVVDDYLEIRPENEERLRRPGRRRPGEDGAVVHPDGRVPRLGRDDRARPADGDRAAARPSAAPWTSATCPTCSATSPRCPRSSGWPGSPTPSSGAACPRRSRKTGFCWEAPDGSTVRAEYLPVGYGNGAALPDDAKALVRRIDDHVPRGRPIPPRRPAAHERLRPPRAPALARARRRRGERHPGRLRFEITSLPQYLADAPAPRASTLAGRAAVRRPGQRADGRHVEPGRRQAPRARGRARPRAAGRAAAPRSSSRPTHWPARLLELAWREIVRNAAHDSICACSVDDVVDAVLHRFAEARQIADGLADRALEAFARSMAEPGPVGGQPVGPRPRRAWSSWSCGGRPPGDDVQVLSERAGLARARWCSTPTPSAPCSACCRARRSTTTPGSTTSDRRGREGIDVTVAVGTEERPASPSPRPSRTLHPTRRPARRRWCASPRPAPDPAHRRPGRRRARLRLASVRPGAARPPGRGHATPDDAAGRPRPTGS